LTSQATLASWRQRDTASTSPGQRAVNALHDGAGRPRATVVYLPRYRLDDPFAEHLAGLLPPMGIEVWRFVMPDLARSNSLPSAEVQDNVWRAVLGFVKADGRPVVAAAEGRAGRALSELLAREAIVAGLALFKYPFHAYERPKQRHAKHVPAIAVPTLLCGDDHDLEALPFVVREVAESMQGATASIIERPAPGAWGYFQPGAAVALIDFVDAVVAAVR
jgi:predicted alpha/beta-hydrolase family hydrolase